MSFCHLPYSEANRSVAIADYFLALLIQKAYIVYQAQPTIYETLGIQVKSFFRVSPVVAELGPRAWRAKLF